MKKRVLSSENKSDFKPDPGTDPDGFFFSGVAGHECPTRTLFGC